MLRRILFTSVLGVAALAGAQNPLDKVMEEARRAPRLEANVRVLSDEIGGRVPGTPAMAKAVAWAAGEMKAAGADSVVEEAFTMPLSWAEGATSVRITEPVSFPVKAVASPWSPAFAPAGPVRIVDVGDGSEAAYRKAGAIQGAVVLVHSKVGKTWGDLFMDYMIAPPVLQRAEAGGAAAVAFISTREQGILYRHINNLQGRLTKLPTFIVAREDGERIARLLDGGKPVSAAVRMPNRIGPAFTTHNVVGEVRGRERPDEYVILGAHLDSWDLGTGALDNGANSALVIEGLRAIKASGVTPRRSIRFILYSGEEQGMLGSRDYTIRHRAELDHVIAQVIYDAGTGAVTGYSLGGRKDAHAAITRLLQPVGAGEMTTDAFVGTDNVHMLLEGVLTLVANQKEDNYLPNYHASTDTYDKADMAALRRHTVLAAATVFALADAPERPAKRLSAAETETLIRETGLDAQLKTFNMWGQWREILARRTK